MIEPIQEATYAFVSYEGSKLPEDPKVRCLIRRRAMRHTATIRKRAGGYKRCNVRQLPSWLLEPEVPNEDPKSYAASWAPGAAVRGHQDDETQSGQVSTRTKKPLASTSWDTSSSPTLVVTSVTAISQNFPLLNLASPLTVLHLGISTLSYFACGSAGVGEVLSKMPQHLKNRRLLSFIPSRYGLVSSITHATDCLIARLEQIVQAGAVCSTEGDVSVLIPYTKALRSLQEAIDDESLRMMPETLCAAELLGLFELLSGTSEIDRWIRHAGGAARLIELQGPDGFQTDFELSLFMSHTGPIVTEAFLNGKTCFLDGERWQSVIQAAIRNDPLIPPDQAHIVIQLWARLGKLPNLFNEAENLILHPTLAPPGACEDLIACLLHEQDHLKSWLNLAEQYQYGLTCHGRRDSAHRNSASLWDCNIGKATVGWPVTWRVLHGTYLLCSMVKTRTLFALSPSRFGELEATCQTLAHEALNRTMDSGSDEQERLIGGLFMSEIGWMANAVIETKESWSVGLLGGCLGLNENKTGMIESWRFEAWCKAMGRKYGLN